MIKKQKTLTEKKTRRYEIRLSENEWNQLQELSKNFDMPISEFIRWSVFQRKVTMRILIDDESSALSKIRFQLEKIGININQIAKAINSGIVNPALFREELKTMFAEIHGQIDLLNRVQSESNSRWKTAMSKYSKYYLFDKTIGAEKNGNDTTSGTQK